MEGSVLLATRWRAVTAVGSAGAIALTLSLVPFARADRDPRDLMSPDHHLLAADFVGRVRVTSIAPPEEEEEPTYGITLAVLDTWFSAWEADDQLSFRVAPDSVLVEA